MRDKAGRSYQAGRPDSGLIMSKLHPPVLRPGTVRRQVLVERLAADDSRPIVAVVAPAGYGKTTLLAQWAELNGHAFAWVSVDESDNDPKVLLTYIAEALDAVEPVDDRVFDALASPGSSVPGSVVPQLGSTLSSMTAPVALVLDDVHVLHDRECRAALSVLAGHVPVGARLVLAGRAEPPLRMARLRAEGKVVDIGPADLALEHAETAELLRNAGVTLREPDMDALHQRTEGWAAGLYLAALYLREGGPVSTAAVSFNGADRLVSEYLEAEFLARIPQRWRAFLSRTSVLQRMCGPLCEAVLDQPGADAILENLARSNFLLVPLDRRGDWYRYHHLFRDMLLAELRRHEPGLVPDLLRRAAQWYERSGEPGMALEYWMRAGDTEAVARLVVTLGFPAYQRGRTATVERWFAWLEDRQAIEKHPAVAVLAAMLSAVTGKPTDAERWAKLAERGTRVEVRLPDGSRSIGPWMALLRAMMCRHGHGQMRTDADLAVRTMPAGDFFRTFSLLFQAIAHLMSGDPDGADVLFEETAAVGGASGVGIGSCMALAARSLLAISTGSWEVARQYLSQARSVARKAHIEDYPLITTLYAAAARVALHEGDWSRARAELTRAHHLRPALTYALPHLAVHARLELARCHLALCDYTGVRVLLQEIDEVVSLCPDLGVFNAQAEDLRARLPHARGPSAAGASALTAAELRLLPMLSTHLSFPEIAARLALSPHTIKTQAKSVYRKLGVPSRSQAVTRARELGLMEG